MGHRRGILGIWAVLFRIALLTQFWEWARKPYKVFVFWINLTSIPQLVCILLNMVTVVCYLTTLIKVCVMGLRFRVQIIEKIEGSGATTWWTMDPSVTQIRKRVETNWIITFLFYLGFLSRPFTNQRTAGKGEGFSLTPHYHFHPSYRHLDISRVITAESLPLCIGSSRTRTGSLWFPSASR